MGVHAFAPEVPRVRLDEVTFYRLMAIATGGDAPEPWRQELIDAGLLDEAGVHESLVTGLKAIAEPVVTLQLLVSSPVSTQRHRAWLSADAVSVLLAVQDDVHDLVTMPPTWLTSLLARVVKIGPRREPARRTRSMPAHVWQQWNSSTGRQRDLGFRTAGGPDQWVWEATMAWTGDDGEATVRDLVVLDGTNGTHVVEHDAEEVSAEPSSPTEIWRLINRMLPVGGD